MRINDIEINASLEDILNELISQMRLNNIQYIQKMNNTPTDIQVCCPYHKGGMEKRPSAGIRKTDGLFHCLACGETHSLYEVISHCFGYEDAGIFGIRWLLKNFASVSIEQRKPIKFEISRGKKKEPDSIEYVSEEELDKYRYYHPYWKKRGIVDEEIIELFDLGYDKANKCITFPVRDINGNCLFIARRSVQTKFFSYPAGVEKPLYGLYELYQQDPFPKAVIITESMLDALSFWQVGKYAVALNGTGSDLQFKQLRKLPVRKLILCTDMDKAGMMARRKIRNNIKNKLIMEYILPDGKKDANECTSEELDQMVEIL